MGSGGARLASLWPEPNFVGTTRANYASGPPQVRRRAQYDVRVDHTFSSRDRMFVRASWMDFRGEQHGPFPGAGVGGGNNDFARDHNDAFNLAVSETHVLGSALVHEARLGVNSLTDEQAAAGLRVSEPGFRTCTWPAPNQSRGWRASISAAPSRIPAR